MFPSDGEPEEPGQVRVVYNPKTGKYLFQDPEMGNIFIKRDEAVKRLRYNAEQGQLVDSFGNAVGVGSLGLPAAGYEFEFKYKTASYTPLTTPPQDFQPAPGTTLQLRLVIIDPDGNVHVVYKSFGENQKWDPETEQKMIGEAADEAVPGRKRVDIGSPPLEGLEVRKDYSVMKIATKKIGP